VSAPQTWRRFSILVRPADVEPASALLSTATGSSVVVEEPGEDAARGDALLRVSAFVHSSSRAFAARTVTALFARSRREGLLPGSRLCAAATVCDEDWAESWKRFYRPFAIAPRLWIAPSWESDFKAPRDSRTLWMDPGMAFGTGQHPTTALALRLLLPLVRPARTVIDVGCGSGILGIAAGLAGAHVWACDVDPVAVSAARANFRANGLKPLSLRRFEGVPAAFGRAPLVVANITAEVLVKFAAQLARCLSRGGTLVTSGVTKRGRANVLTAFAGAGLRLCAEQRAGEWLALAHRKR
jgi:ribosomal protein L11 methyltransferase